MIRDSTNNLPSSFVSSFSFITIPENPLRKNAVCGSVNSFLTSLFFNFSQICPNAHYLLVIDGNPLIGILLHELAYMFISPVTIFNPSFRQWLVFRIGVLVPKDWHNLYHFLFISFDQTFLSKRKVWKKKLEEKFGSSPNKYILIMMSSFSLYYKASLLFCQQKESDRNKNAPCNLSHIGRKTIFEP